MPRQSLNLLTDPKIRAWISKNEKRMEALKRSPRKSSRIYEELADGGSLYLTVTASGTLVWKFRFRIKNPTYKESEKKSNKKNSKKYFEKAMSFGIYPTVSLKDARNEREKARRFVAEGKNPIEERKRGKRKETEKVVRDIETFQEYCEKWFEQAESKHKWVKSHSSKVKGYFPNHIYSVINASKPCADVTRDDIENVIKKILNEGHEETARRVLQKLEELCEDMCEEKGLENNPTQGVKRKFFDKKKKASEKHMSSVKNWKGIGEILRKTESIYKGEVPNKKISPPVYFAHILTAFTMQRIGTIVNAKWSEFHLMNSKQAYWALPREHLKIKDTNRGEVLRIPICSTLYNLLTQYRKILEENGLLGESVFPSFERNKKGKVIRRESVEKMYADTLGLKGIHSPHGWRGSFATLIRSIKEFEGFEPAFEWSLDHNYGNEVQRAYDTNDRFDQRRRILERWGKDLWECWHCPKCKPSNEEKCAFSCRKEKKENTLEFLFKEG